MTNSSMEKFRSPKQIVRFLTITQLDKMGLFSHVVQTSDHKKKDFSQQGLITHMGEKYSLQVFCLKSLKS